MQSAALSSATQRTIIPGLGEQWGTEYLNITVPPVYPVMCWIHRGAIKNTLSRDRRFIMEQTFCPYIKYI